MFLFSLSGVPQNDHLTLFFTHPLDLLIVALDDIRGMRKCAGEPATNEKEIHFSLRYFSLMYFHFSFFTMPQTIVPSNCHLGSIFLPFCSTRPNVRLLHFVPGSGKDKHFIESKSLWRKIYLLVLSNCPLEGTLKQQKKRISLSWPSGDIWNQYL